MIRTAVGSEDQVHEREKVRVVSRFARPLMMPVMDLGGAKEEAKGPDWESHVGMNVDGPDASERDKSSQCLQWKTENEGRQIDQTHRIDRVQWMFPMCGKPIEMLGAVMYGVKSPEENASMLQSMPPIDA